MTVPVQIRGGVNGGVKALALTDIGAAYVSVLPYPTLADQKIKPFRQYFTADGTAAGSNDMGVDGSTTNVDFWVAADDMDDRYITNINILVGYGLRGQPNLWADGTALTNGTRMFYESATQGEVEIHEGIKSNQDMFRLNNLGVTTGWEVRHVNATNDYGYFMSVDLTQLMPPNGIKLDAKTTQRLAFTVRDNAGADADTFNAIAYGFDRFK